MPYKDPEGYRKITTMKITIVVSRYVDPHEVVITFEAEVGTIEEAWDFARKITEEIGDGS